MHFNFVYAPCSPVESSREAAQQPRDQKQKTECLTRTACAMESLLFIAIRLKWQLGQTGRAGVTITREKPKNSKANARKIGWACALFPSGQLSFRSLFLANLHASVHRALLTPLASLLGMFQNAFWPATSPCHRPNNGILDVTKQVHVSSHSSNCL